MIASSLRPKHIGKKFRAKADGAPTALEGGLSDYYVKKNMGGKVVGVVVWINGEYTELRPDSTITPVQGGDQRGQGHLI